MGTFYAFIFSFEIWIVDSFAYFFVFFFIHFSIKFMYNANRTSLEGRKKAITFLTECWATLPGIDKLYVLVICDHGTQSRRGGRFSNVLDFYRGNTRGFYLVYNFNAPMTCLNNI